MAPIVEEPIIRPTMIQNIEILGFGSILYGIIYSFCMYKNLYGITSTLLVWVTFAYGYFVLNKLNYKFDKKHIVYGVLGGLLGLNLMWTSDWAILLVDYLAIILVFIRNTYTPILERRRACIWVRVWFSCCFKRNSFINTFSLSANDSIHFTEGNKHS